LEKSKKDIIAFLALLLMIAALFALFVFLQKDTAINNLGSYIGDFVLILVLFSFSLWYINRFLFKKKGKILFSVLILTKKYHMLIGFLVWLLISIHGYYFLFVSDLRYSPEHAEHMSHSIQTGLVAYILLTVLAVVGVLLKKLPNKTRKRIHRITANLLLFIIYLHIGGWLKLLLALLLLGHWIFLGISRMASRRLLHP
jgi:glucan phosphoethanolaminetransferase (alkaline phosphatase superfamily)